MPPAPEPPAPEPPELGPAAPGPRGPRPSAPELLCLHAVRLLGFADVGPVAARFGLDRADVGELLLDFQAVGWVTRSAFAGTAGWSLTESGRREDERRLAAELDAAGARPALEAALTAFEPLNARLQDAVTRWQIRPLPGDPLAANDHSDFRWDDRALQSMASVGLALDHLGGTLAARLTRFDGYGRRFRAALDRVRGGERRWVDGLGIDSCHIVWMQLHEDLLSTLGIPRGAQIHPNG